MNIQIGTISNYYGGLYIKEEKGLFYWGIEDWCGIQYQEIPKTLYNALLEYEKSLQVK